MFLTLLLRYHHQLGHWRCYWVQSLCGRNWNTKGNIIIWKFLQTAYVQSSRFSKYTWLLKHSRCIWKMELMRWHCTTKYEFLISWIVALNFLKTFTIDSSLCNSLKSSRMMELQKTNYSCWLRKKSKYQRRWIACPELSWSYFLQNRKDLVSLSPVYVFYAQ